MRSERTVGTIGVAASLVPAVTGLVASTMLAVDYVRPIPVFCSEGGGCDAVRRTVLAVPFGVPLPMIGIAGFLAIGMAALFAGQRARLVQVGLASLAGLVGALLLAAQGAIGHFCVYCCVADTSALVSAMVAAIRFWRAPGAGAPRLVVCAAVGALAAAAVVPLAMGLRSSAVPRVIRDEIARTGATFPRGAVTLVDFVDFECPFCRMMQAELEPLVLAHKERIHVVRRQVPLRIHAHAHDAARAACCGDRLGKGDAMASALFAAPVEQLTPEHCESIAEGLGLPLAPYRACVRDPATDASIEADRAEFKAAGGFALPTVWVGERQIVGAQPADVLAKALEEALNKSGALGGT